MDLGCLSNRNDKPSRSHCLAVFHLTGALTIDHQKAEARKFTLKTKNEVSNSTSCSLAGICNFRFKFK